MDYEQQLEAARAQAIEMGYDPDDDFVINDLLEGAAFIAGLGV